MVVRYVTLRFMFYVFFFAFPGFFAAGLLLVGGLWVFYSWETVGVEVPVLLHLEGVEGVVLGPVEESLFRAALCGVVLKEREERWRGGGGVWSFRLVDDIVNSLR